MRPLVLRFLFFFGLIWLWVYSDSSPHNNGGPSEKVGAPSSEEILGYQDISFGIDVKKLASMKKCSLSKFKDASSASLTTYGCQNFRFGDQPVAALFTFADNELVRMEFILGEVTSGESIRLYSKALTDKFGQPYKLNQSELEAFDAGKIDQASVSWNTDQVALKVTRIENHVMATISYSDLFIERKIASVARKVGEGL
ncbi:MAG: hypothetical protein JST16_06485 [Bdellovibrionales bacterium]|nr:hypothetical protein [Bdellovibrionales bacterium]